MSILNVTPTQLREAADLKEQIASLQTKLAAVLGDQAPSPAVPKPAKRKMSASAIAKIRAAQKLRWAKLKGDKPAAKLPKKGGISAAGRARMAAAARARWAKVKAAKGNLVTIKSVGAVKPVAKPAVVSKPARKKISAEGIARIKAAQKARWAKIHAEKAAKKK